MSVKQTNDGRDWTLGQPGRPITICAAPAHIDDDESGRQFFFELLLFKLPSFIYELPGRDYTKSVVITFPFEGLMTELCQ